MGAQSIQWHKERLNEQLEYAQFQEEIALSTYARIQRSVQWLKKQTLEYESRIAEAERQGLAALNYNEFYSGTKILLPVTYR